MDAPRIKAWQCVGCGRIDGAAPCVGVCRDQSVELVAARHYDEALARIGELEAALRRIVGTRPSSVSRGTRRRGRGGARRQVGWDMVSGTAGEAAAAPDSASWP